MREDSRDSRPPMMATSKCLYEAALKTRPYSFRSKVSSGIAHRQSSLQLCQGRTDRLSQYHTAQVTDGWFSATLPVIAYQESAVCRPEVWEAVNVELELL